MKNYILFDLDGTLTDSQEGIIKSVRYALEDIKPSAESDEVMKRYIGPPLIDSFKEFDGLDDETAKRAVKRYRERYNTVGLYENKLIEGMDECVKRLKESGKKIALATCKPEQLAIQIIEHFNLTPYFDVLVGSLDDTRKYKNQVIEEVFRRFEQTDLNFKRESAIMVGDRKDDVLGAKKAGIQCIGVGFGFAKEGEFEEAGADYVVNLAKELTDFILEL